MGADSTLVNAAFRESATRAGANVPNLKPLYDSTVKQGRQSFGIITGIMDELKQSIENGFVAIGFLLFIILAVLLFPIIGWHIIWVMPVIMGLFVSIILTILT